MYAKNTWSKYQDQDYKNVMDFNEGYKAYISEGKTERACVKASIRLAKEYGFKDISEFDSLKAGDKVYVVNKKKNIALFVMGEKPLVEGMRILGAHIDSPRLDLKQNPLYESDGFALLDTHYYGGVKKYQWVTIPLSLHGVVVKKDGSVIDVVIGEDDNDPVVGITDLLIHLSATQLQKTADKVIEGENLDVNVGSIPLDSEEKDAVKANVLKLLKEKYDIEEEDFLSAEIEVVPSGKARDFGLDRSMILGYGHDDRVCAYTSLMAILETNNPTYTSCCILVDKEEIGSVGATGAQSLFFENTIAELLHLCGDDSYLSLKRTMTNSQMLSSDVSAGFDPLYKEVNDAKNAAYLGNGIVFNKYTGARGKSGSNDANPEYMAKLRQIMDEAKIHFQTAELGKVDQGGGGTIAYILGNYNMDVIDAGIAVLNMHAPYEIVSKVDVYEGYLAYKVFLEN
ncbi:MAG: aminopeptidase [Longibaculum muris]|uniref:M18 family aminopeptidase n=1 Tax=Longibaculum muris TaxID=1796628 RepID=A0A4R3Z6C2_9FIRM|nr:aminopeptidase [Longibaculum muris]KXU51153.1 aminopeptidase I zinc metalloprotease [Candidatus Stoquefichus sp. KLE1796]MBS5369018.1 aminopeptidase [Coprobacillus cateniformis]MCR1887649.1 aminopeptidase [Longibaculum muris]MED9813245.1 aminopeptidase [Longibaculum muris]TCV99506.1 aspartyl aminopeptidase [Longibaculum muris]